jgi:hypothetical protein
VPGDIGARLTVIRAVTPAVPAVVFPAGIPSGVIFINRDLLHLPLYYVDGISAKLSCLFLKETDSRVYIPLIPNRYFSQFLIVSRRLLLENGDGFRGAYAIGWEWLIKADGGRLISHAAGQPQHR